MGFVIKAATFFIIALHAIGAIAVELQATDTQLSARQDDSAGTNILLQIAPSSSSCSGATYPSECATAGQAFAPLISSFNTYNITTGPEQAALLSWQAFESAEFKYNHNHFPSPGRPGQGCRNMMMPNYVTQFAATLPAVQSKLAGNTDPDTVLDTTIAAGHEWDAAAWFYSSQCSESIKQGVQAATEDGWKAFVTTCVGTDWSEGSGSTSREAYWKNAMRALGWTDV